MFKLFSEKGRQALVPMEETDESRDEIYQLPVLHAARFTMSPELSRRKKDERLRKRYGTEPKS